MTIRIEIFAADAAEALAQMRELAGAHRVEIEWRQVETSSSEAREGNNGGAQASEPEVASNNPTPSPAPSTETAAEPKQRRGRPRKTESSAPQPQAAGVSPQPAAAEPKADAPPAPAPAAAPTTTFNPFEDEAPTVVPAEMSDKDFRDALNKLIAVDFTPRMAAVTEILGKYGARLIREVKPEDRAKIVADATARFK